MSGGGTGPMNPGNQLVVRPIWCQILQRVFLWEMRVGYAKEQTFHLV